MEQNGAPAAGQQQRIERVLASKTESAKRGHRDAAVAFVTYDGAAADLNALACYVDRLEIALRDMARASLPPPARNGEMSTQDAKDAARYRWLRDRPALSVFTGERVRFRPFDCPHEIEVGQIGAVDLDDAIDAALSASCAPKQTEGDGK